MVTLVLCHDADTSATWAASGLRARGADVVVATASELGCALRCEHRVDDDGIMIDLILPRGRRWKGGEVTGVLDRLRFMPTPRTPGVAASDLEYAREELNALTLSWLAGLARAGCPFVGRPHGAGLSGEWRYPSEWRSLARAAGLPTAPLVLDTDAGIDVPGSPAVASAVSLCGRAFGAPTKQHSRGVVRLAGLADSDSLTVWFDALGRVVGADPLGDLQVTGARGLDALADWLGVRSIAEVPG